MPTDIVREKNLREEVIGEVSAGIGLSGLLNHYDGAYHQKEKLVFIYEK